MIDAFSRLDLFSRSLVGQGDRPKKSIMLMGLAIPVVMEDFSAPVNM